MRHPVSDNLGSVGKLAAWWETRPPARKDKTQSRTNRPKNKTTQFKMMALQLSACRATQVLLLGRVQLHVEKGWEPVKDRGEDSPVDIMKFKIILCRSAVIHLHM